MWASPSSPPQPSHGRGGSPSLGEVREGFLCPLCLKDLLSVQQLQAHYEEAHSSDDDRHMVGQIKTFFGRAKRRLLKRDESGQLEPEPQDLVYTGGVDTSKWEPQDLGVTRSVRSEFQQWRGARINHYVIEVNKLLIRLEKLTAFDRTATDPAKKKALERSVVSWVSDRDVPYCPDCGAHFSLTLRRHHCRLCGSIMCKRCSHFLSVHFAQKLTSAVRASVTAGSAPVGSERMPSGGESSRRSSVSSVGSLLEDSEDDRIVSCGHCCSILERQERRLEERESSPVICQLYQKLRSCIVRVEELAPKYGKMADSLNAGESTFGLEQAVQLRMELMKLYERIDLLSKKMASLGLSGEPPPHPKALQLQKMIRFSAAHFLQEKLLGLTSLPSLEKLEELKEKRRQRDLGVPPTGQGPSRVTVGEETGWLASPLAPAQRPGLQPQDPLLEQIDNIRNFLAQARAAGRQSEALALEENLDQLTRELEAQRRREGAGAPGWMGSGQAEGHGRKDPLPGSRILAERRFGDRVQEECRSGNPFEEDHCSGNQFQEEHRSSNQVQECRSGNPFEEDSCPGNQLHAERHPGNLMVATNPFEEEGHPGNPLEEEGCPGNHVSQDSCLANPFEQGSGPRNHVQKQRGKPEASNPFEEEEEEEIEEELLRQQIDNIKAFAFDAKQAGRLDEVASLMDNLSELRRALEHQQGRRRPR
ncbi:rabenosyn-5 [Mobula hypostoma]|uniref:rabenosyn-5 n=1 Tax=Mobula hypostoma TaxID=723540 RepID=UPI002FC2C259